MSIITSYIQSGNFGARTAFIEVVVPSLISQDRASIIDCHKLNVKAVRAFYYSTIDQLLQFLYQSVIRQLYIERKEDNSHLLSSRLDKIEDKSYFLSPHVDKKEDNSYVLLLHLDKKEDKSQP